MTRHDEFQEKLRQMEQLDLESLPIIYRRAAARYKKVLDKLAEFDVRAANLADKKRPFSVEKQTLEQLLIPKLIESRSWFFRIGDLLIYLIHSVTKKRETVSYKEDLSEVLNMLKKYEDVYNEAQNLLIARHPEKPPEFNHSYSLRLSPPSKPTEMGMETESLPVGLDDVLKESRILNEMSMRTANKIRLLLQSCNTAAAVLVKRLEAKFGLSIG